MTDSEAYEVIIIGTGQAGKPLAGAFAAAGVRSAIIERDHRVGGTCVVSGCTPTKTMIASARIAHLVGRAGDYGVNTGPVSVDLEVVRKRKRDIVDSWTAGSQKGMERHDTLDLIFGEARFDGPRELIVTTPEGTERRLTADKIFINTGTRNLVPGIEGLGDVDYLDNESLMELGRVPEHLIIIGGGFLGLEFGQMFRRFGANVTIIELLDRLLPREDEDVSEALQKILEDEGIEILLGANAERVTATGDGGVEVTIGTPDGGRTVAGSHLLVSIGRVPNTDALQPEKAGVELTERRHIGVNDRLETNVEGIWALGDVNGGPPFTHTSYDDYRIVAENVLGGGEASRSGRIVPYTMFTDPQLGRVGLTEREAREQGFNVLVGSLPMSRVARAIEMDETRGFMKVVVDADTDQILGASVLGIEGGEVATVLQVAMLGKLPYTALRDGVFSHPTLSESLNNLFMAMAPGH